MPTPVSLLLLLAAVAAHGQGRFEVASLKISPPFDRTKLVDVSCSGGPGTSDPGLYACRYYSMQGLLIEAFGLMPYEIPYDASRDALTYDVMARVPPGASREQFREMLQQLLAERLKLVYHFKKMPGQVYDLAIAKDGPKLQESRPRAANESLKAAASERDQYGIRNPPVDFEGQEIRRNADVARWIARRVTMPQIAKRLQSLMQSPVTDSTGLKGTYDFALYFSASRGRPPQPATPAPAARKVGEEAAEGVNLPPLSAVLRDKLGLTLRKQDGFFDLLVVDHVEKVPTEN